MILARIRRALHLLAHPLHSSQDVQYRLHHRGPWIVTALRCSCGRQFWKG